MQLQDGLLILDKLYARQTKNDYFWEMLTVAPARGLQPRYVLCDSWYSHLDNLKHLRVWPFPG